MIALHRWKPVFVAALLVGVVLAIAACSSVPSAQVSKAKAAGDFGVVVQAFKSGQFMLDGAIISPLDLSSHFAYLRDQHKLPTSVLLERSKEQKIRKQHLQEMAAMALLYGFTVYYNDGGELKRIIPNAKNRIQLKGAPPAKKDQGQSQNDRYDATHVRA